MGEPPTFPLSSHKPKYRVPPRAPWPRVPGLRHLWSSALPPSPRAAHPLHRSEIRPMPHQSVWMSRRPPIRGSWRRIWGDFLPVMKLRCGPQILRGRASARRFRRTRTRVI
uniref:Uncharacterized protein n=1 Tax=Zea mays TaxID=4577 RepID=B4FMU8_MAIZE|nr:unknown [Zea mays]